MKDLLAHHTLIYIFVTNLGKRRSCFGQMPIDYFNATSLMGGRLRGKQLPIAKPLQKKITF